MTLQARWDAVMMNNYGTPPLALVGGDGAVVTDESGKHYLDLLGGIAVNLLGHRHPAVIEAVTAQLNTLGHTSNLYATEPGIALAEQLVGHLGESGASEATGKAGASEATGKAGASEATGKAGASEATGKAGASEATGKAGASEATGKAGASEATGKAGARAFFCNSGTEANEVAFKITRLTGRTNIVAAEGAFHGRTMGSLALTGQPAKQAPFEPLPGNVTHVPYGDMEALARAVDDSTAAVFLEPIMGEGGVVVPPAGYLAAAREITAKHGALLVLDEVQTGIGRTGAFYAHQHDGITPDIITLAKGLGGGLPIGACLAIGATGDLLTPGLHGSTFGGNPVCTAAALGVLKALAEGDLVARAGVLGKTLSHGIEELGHPLVDHVRGKGLLQGIVLTAPSAKAVETAARDAGFLVNAAAADVIRLAPPLIITDSQIEDFLTALPAVLDNATEGTA